VVDLPRGLSLTPPQETEEKKPAPVSTAEPERCCRSLKNSKPTLGTAWDKKDIPLWLFLSIHKGFFADTVKFNQNVLELSAAPNNQIGQFLHK
jgi:hypothetical protein